KSFFAYQMDSDSSKLEMRNDTLWSNGNTYALNGKNLNHPDSLPPLRTIQAYQEFWHSWKTFHPETERDGNE
ncbi:MAG TPA: hypothetical protein VFX48_03780, partial [Saprospiraceae bacterium]|nr:hypothetical protein [Saprospiraceae bacterium]